MAKSKSLFIVALVVGTVLSRLLPHPANWTAAGALAIWSSTLFRDRWMALATPLAALFLSDLLLGFQNTFMTPWSASMFWVYGAYILLIALGMGLQPQKGAFRAIGTSVSGSLIFFLVTNFGTWASSGLYSHTSEGLSQCFVAALPFFSAQAMGDLVYCGVFAGVVMTFGLAAEPATHKA